MADNITTQSATLASPPAGAVFAFDEVAIDAVNVLVGRNKIGYGAGGAYTEVDGTNPFPIAAPASVRITPAITVDTAVYAAGDCVGGKITLASAVRAAGLRRAMEAAGLHPPAAPAIPDVPEVPS